MDFLQQLQIWAKGDAMQGRVMLIAGIMLLIGAIFILKGSNPLLKGMLIPLALMILVNVGYGGFLAFARPNHIVTTTASYEQDRAATLEKELAKANRDYKAYSTVPPVWAVLIGVCLIMFFVFTKEYYKGLSLGLIGLFFAILLIDTFLKQKLTPYLETLRDLTAQ